MSTVNISTPRWKEYTIGVWIILAVIAGLVLLFAWPVIETTCRLIQFLWVVYSNEWTDGGF